MHGCTSGNMIKSVPSICRRCSKSISSLGTGSRPRYVSTTTSEIEPQAGPSRSHIFDIPIDTASRPRTAKRVRIVEYHEAKRRSKTAEEMDYRESWRADPWYAIYRSSERQCAITRQSGPSGLMVNFRVARLEDTTNTKAPKSKDPAMYLVPDRILHPRFERQKTGISIWTQCHHSIVARLDSPGPHMVLTNTKRAQVAPGIVDLVFTKLRQRVIQELSLLQERMTATNLRPGQRAKVASSSDNTDLSLTMETPPIVSRLTEEEAEQVRDGVSEIPGAIAYLVLPIIRHRTTTPDLTASDPETGAEKLLPLDVDIPPPGPERKGLPLYPLTQLFQDEEYVTVRQLLGKMLATERNVRLRTQQAKRISTSTSSSPSGGTKIGTESIPNTSPASDIIVLRSYPRTSGEIRPGNMTVPLAVALWRMRCYLGQGWKPFDVDGRGRRV